MRDWSGFLAIIGSLLVIIVIVLFVGCRSLDPYEAGVKFNKVSEQLTEHDPGVLYVWPVIENFDRYDLSQQQITMAGSEDSDGKKGPDSTWVRGITRDGQSVYVDTSLIYRVNPDQVLVVHLEWQERLGTQYVVPAVRSGIRDAVGQFTAEELYEAGREKLREYVLIQLNETFEQDNLVLLGDVLIRDITFEEQFMDAIERKQIQEQAAQEAENKIRQAEAEANQIRARAQGQADASIISAEGEAQATILRAEADAEALTLQGRAQADVLEMVGQQLTEGGEELVQWTYINELGEEIDMVIIPSNSPYLFDFSGMTEPAP